MPGGELTIAAWIKSNTWATGDVRIISKVTGTAENDHYWMISERDNLLRFRLKTNGANTTLLAGGPTLPLNDWVHVAAVYDGAEVARASKSGPLSTAPTVAIHLAQSPVGAPNSYNGLLDEIHIYNRALPPPPEIQSLTTQPIGNAEPTPTPTPTPGSDIVTFENLSPENDKGSHSDVTFSSDITSSYGILRVYLWGDWSGKWQPESFINLAPVSGELLKNNSFENSKGTVTDDWDIVSDGATQYGTAVDEGYDGQAQRIDLDNVASWGLFFYQTPPMELGKMHQWRFWYKTSGINAVSAEITNGSTSEIVLREKLPGTSGLWEPANLTFAYDNLLANQLRIHTGEAGSVWLDEFTLKSFEQGTYPFEASPDIALNLEQGTYNWALEVSTIQGSVFSPKRTLTITGPAENSVGRTWTFYG